MFRFTNIVMNHFIMKCVQCVAVYVLVKVGVVYIQLISFQCIQETKYAADFSGSLIHLDRPI